MMRIKLHFPRPSLTYAISSFFAAVASLTASAVQAQDNSGASYRFSGFGTVGGTHLSEKLADFTSVNDRPNGPGYTRSWDFDTDTKLAGQTDIKWREDLSFTAQVMTRQRYDNSYRPELMMAFVKWQATPEFAFRAGRLPMPVFLISDSRNVGYSQIQLRPPVDLYHQLGANHYDGGDLTWTGNIGEFALKGQVYIGTSKVRNPNDTVLKLSPLSGANFNAEVGNTTVRVSYIGFQTALSSPPLDKIFNDVHYGFPEESLGPGFPALPGSPEAADDYEIRDKYGSYKSVGVNYDVAGWFITSEIGVLSAIGFSPKKTMGYLSSGAHLGNFTPYGTVSSIRAQIAGSTTNHPVVDAIRESSAGISQKTFAIGLRWDIVKNAALKIQFDHVKLSSGSSGLLINMQPGFKPGKAYNVASTSLDFVF